LKWLKLKLEQVVANDGVEVDDSLSENLQLVKVSKIILREFFWEQQV